MRKEHKKYTTKYGITRDSELEKLVKKLDCKSSVLLIEQL
jgi:hypothetical protein